MAQYVPKFQEESSTKLPAMTLLPQFDWFFLASNSAFVTSRTKSFFGLLCYYFDSNLPGKRRVMIEVTA